MSENQNQNRTQRPMQIQQQNVDKSLISQFDLLQNLRQDDYNVCIIQELFVDFEGKTRANCQWTTVYPNTHREYPGKARSIILVNTDILTHAWKQINFQHPDITTIGITGDISALQYINTYNDGGNNKVLTHLSVFIRDRGRLVNSTHTLGGWFQPPPPALGWTQKCIFSHRKTWT